MNDRRIGLILRTVAIVIAVLAVIDPSITSNRSPKPEVSVVAVNAQSDSLLALRVVDKLSKSFTVLREAFGGAAATIVVGSHLPADANSAAGTTFVVLPDARSVANVETVVVPTVAGVDARVPVTAQVRLQKAGGKNVELTLTSNGNIVDRATRTVKGDSAQFDVPLSYVPTAPGATVLRVSANIAGSSDSSSADVVLNVREQKWAVLFFDARPSWMSTFVRRSVERDPRLAVTSRVVTSTNVSTDAGRPPATLNDPTLVELYDAIVVGAPEALAERDVAGLETFLRRRGGSVVLLFDGNRNGRYERLAPFPAFVNTSNSLPAVISGVAGDSVVMRTTEWMWPARLPDGASVLAWSEAKDGRQPIVWTSQVGAGRMIVSGALDAWKFRDGSQSGFERFWQQTIGAAAASAPPAIGITLSSTPAGLGGNVDVKVTARDAALAELRESAPVRAEVSVAIGGDSTRIPVRVWPTGTPGEFAGTFRAPETAGAYSVAAAANGTSASVPLVVASQVRTANRVDVGMISAFAAARGGKVVSESDVSSLPGLLAAALDVQPRRVPWHPMRSAWWLLPFGLLLSGEWFLRRRRGQA